MVSIESGAALSADTEFSDDNQTVKEVPEPLQLFLNLPAPSICSSINDAMPANVLTTEDFEIFKQELFSEIERILSTKQGGAQRKWLKSNEVRRLLLVSPGTLQNMRVNGMLPFTKIGSVIFYDYEDIRKMIESRKQNPNAKSAFDRSQKRN